MRHESPETQHVHYINRRRSEPMDRTRRESDMYGLIGKMMATPGKRSELIAILLDGVTNMPGCLAYIVGEDINDANAI